MRLAGQVEAATVRYWTAMERHKLYISEHGQHAGGGRRQNIWDRCGRDLVECWPHLVG